jgi:hypothetical protein
MTHIPSWAIPGAKVVCIGSGFVDQWVDQDETCLPDASPTYGAVYEIMAIKRFGDDVGLRLVGLHELDWFDSDEFRPLTKSTQEQDLELFNKLLTQPGNLPSEMDDQEAIVDACLYAVNKAWGAS